MHLGSTRVFNRTRIYPQAELLGIAILDNMGNGNVIELHSTQEWKDMLARGAKENKAVSPACRRGGMQFHSEGSMESY